MSWLGGTFPGSLTGPGPHSQLCSCLSYFTPKLGVTDPPIGRAVRMKRMTSSEAPGPKPWARA